MPSFSIYSNGGMCKGMEANTYNLSKRIQHVLKVLNEKVYDLEIKSALLMFKVQK